MHSRRLSGSDDGAEVLGIFHAVENHEERRFALLSCQLKNVLCAAVSLGRDKGDDPLMIAAGNQAVESRRRLNMDRNALGLGLFHEVTELPIRTQDEETLERTAAGSQGFANGMQPIQQFGPVTASSGWCRRACPR